LFMITAGLMQLIVGPLSDCYGRRLISFIMTVIFAVGTILCSFSHNIEQLILFRCLQAVGACGMLVVGFAIVRDLYSGRKSAQAYSYLNGMISFSPMFAPFIGSYLDVYYGWPSTFLALLIIAIFGLIVIIFWLPETLLTYHRKVFRISIIRKYKQIGKNPVFFFYNTSACVGLSYLFLFCSISPYIIIRLLHIPEIDYGFYFCYMGISFFIGSFISGYIVSKFGIYNTVLLGLILSLLGGITMTAWYFTTGLTINNFIWPMLLIGIGGTFCMGAGNGGAMEPFPEDTGTAAALGGALRFLFAGILGSIVITSKVTSTLPLALSAIIFSAIGILIFLVMRARLQFQE
ncbi:MAG: multidrug effflux MFS transporter, partial [Gammaproteobacteria bacterium]|nr:multidrug effflux MFS transporter [Gammaproteobacteria bacterium]